MFQLERLVPGLTEAIALCAALLAVAALYFVWSWRARADATPAEPPFRRRRSDRLHRKRALRLVRPPSLTAPSQQEEPAPGPAVSDTAAPTPGP
jgi:hypothetical protein